MIRATQRAWWGIAFVIWASTQSVLRLVIAAVNGDAYGGGAELASRCDLRVMDSAAVFCFSEAKLGLMPDWGGGPGLTRLIGVSRAADMILTGR